MARFRSSVKNKINLGDVGSAAVIVDAPESHVQFNLKSLHSSSYIRCASAEITFEEEFDQCNIYDHACAQMLLGDSTEEKPTLHVHTT